MESLSLHHPTRRIQAAIRLVSSKSESNRALIINALGGHRSTLGNLSEARDTRTMQRLLASPDPVWDVLDAGTTMRFLTAYAAVTHADKTLTGTPRMCERPIGLLVDALRLLGADIDYLGREGYPPLRVRGMAPNGTQAVQMRGDVSSQYVSALLMIAPLLPGGLSVSLAGPVGSRPYIQMTLRQMEAFGAGHTWAGDTITVPPQTYRATDYHVESDWSGASYWYSIAALADEADIELLGLKADSLQGDSRIAAIMEPLGVASTFTERGVRLRKTAVQPRLAVDFTDCPDLAQTVAVCAAALGVEAEFTGIESLKIKETDRVAALQAELRKFGADLVEMEANHRYVVPKSDFKSPAAEIETYDDHRMAMAFAPLALRHPLVIRHPQVVVKSYPGFWEDLKQAGFQVGVAPAE